MVLGKHTGGGLSIDPRALMESLRLWKGLKDKAETNNHSLDSQRSQDKTFRSIQQKLLGMLRAYPVVHAAVQDEDRAESPIARVFHSGPKGSKATHSGASLGNDSKERIGFCLHRTLPKVYSMSFLVGGKCNPTDSGTDYKRHFPENKTAFKFVNERKI